MSHVGLPASSFKCRAIPNVIRRSFEPHDQMLYHRTILEPHTAYPIPAGTYYIVLTVQKTAFGLDIIPESLLPQLIQKGFHLGDFRQKMKNFDQTSYKLLPPTPAHVPAEKRPLEEKFMPFSKRRFKVSSTPVIRLAYRRPELPMAEPPVPESIQIPEPMQIPEPHVPEPPVQIPESLVQIPGPPVQIPEPSVQIPKPRVPEPVQIPELDAASLDQLMSFVIGEEPELLAHTKNSSCFTRYHLFLMETMISSHSWINLKGR
ncbi:uncharacterized protein TNCV_3871371 [Trichonephila clavipes]|nr:uncharacterized protein TNCV_3871371 [Trichonephila clavipes]